MFSPAMELPFWYFLPEYGIAMSQEDQIRWLTDQVSFALISNSPWKSVEEVDFTWRWLYGAIRYVYENYPQTEWNFYSVFRFSEENRDFREAAFCRNEECLLPLRNPQKPELFDSLEKAVSEMTEKNLRYTLR